MKCKTSKINSWQQALIDVITDPEELLHLLALDPALLPDAQAAAKIFPLKVPRSLISRMKQGDRNDPILLQVLPIHAELDAIVGYNSDPLEESSFNPAAGLLHKYHGRVLLTFTGTCGINCRYCFRRHFPYEENSPGSKGWQTTLDYIKNDPSITEVILSGGDPLIANDLTFKNFALRLTEIPHVTRLRIHSRLPIVLPERITPEFVEAITSAHFKTILVIHCNHANELNPDVQYAMNILREKGVIVLNQSVLLKGVNDHVDTLVRLSEQLFHCGILPYYLHALDKVQGAAHFDLTIHTAKALHEEMAKKLPGYLVPKLVCEQPGAASKLPL